MQTPEEILSVSENINHYNWIRSLKANRVKQVLTLARLSLIVRRKTLRSYKVSEFNRYQII